MAEIRVEAVTGDALWADEAHAYAVVATRGALVTRRRGGLSHTEAMACADDLRRGGAVVSVMHVVGDRSYEVDRYPAR